MKTKTTSQETVEESKSVVIGKTVSLAVITDKVDIEKNARFLNELRKKFDSFKSSTHFTSARQQIETAYQNAWRTLKKRIKNKVWLSNYKCTSMGKTFGTFAP